MVVYHWVGSACWGVGPGPTVLFLQENAGNIAHRMQVSLEAARRQRGVCPLFSECSVSLPPHSAKQTYRRDGQ